MDRGRDGAKKDGRRTKERPRRNWEREEAPALPRPSHVCSAGQAGEVKSGACETRRQIWAHAAHSVWGRRSLGEDIGRVMARTDS